MEAIFFGAFIYMYQGIVTLHFAHSGHIMAEILCPKQSFSGGWEFFIKVVWLVDGIELESGRSGDRSKKVPFSIPM